MTIPKNLYRNITILLIFVLGILFAASITVRVMQLEKQADTHEKFELVTMIARSIDGLRTEAVRDKDNKQYVPEVRMELPKVNDKVGFVGYSVMSAQPPLEINISSNRLTNTEKNKLLADSRLTVDQILASVAKLQACSRGAYITDYLIKDSSYGPNYGSKKLKNGQTIYFYMEDRCKDQDLLEYVKSIESY